MVRRDRAAHDHAAVFVPGDLRIFGGERIEDFCAFFFLNVGNFRGFVGK
jgi:hypothetical protein